MRHNQLRYTSAKEFLLHYSNTVYSTLEPACLVALRELKCLPGIPTVVPSSSSSSSPFSQHFLLPKRSERPPRNLLLLQTPSLRPRNPREERGKREGIASAKKGDRAREEGPQPQSSTRPPLSQARISPFLYFLCLFFSSLSCQRTIPNK